MDTVTHALMGLCIARSLPGKVRGRDTAVLVVAASLLPDINVLWSMSEPATAALNRHLLTHSLVGIALLSTGFGAAAWLFARRLSITVIVGLVALAVLAHVGLDLINAYGVALLYPWSTFRYELPLAFILDPILTGVLLTGVLVPFVIRDTRLGSVLSRSTLLLVGCYLAACFGLRMIAQQLVVARAGAAGGDLWTYLVPELGAPLRWQGIYREGLGYRQVLVYPLSDRVIDLASVHSTPDLAAVAAVRATATGKRIEAFFKAPVWRTEGKTVVAYDLRFRFGSLGNDWDPFGFCFQLQGGGFAPVQETLSTYVANWRKAFLGFGSTITSCAAARTGLEPDAH